MSTQQLQKTEERPMEFIPFGSADKIKLTVKIIQNVIAVPTKSGKTCTERDAVKFMMLCQAQRLNPFAGDAFLIGYDSKDGPTFSLITAHQAFLKRAETCPDYEGMESGVIIQADENERPLIVEREGDFHLADEVIVGGWARVHRKGRRPTYRRIRMDRFNKGFAEWAKDPAGMIVKCAEADALRSTFPTLLGGLYTGEQISDGAERIVSDMVTTRPIFETPAPREIEPPASDGDLGPQSTSEGVAKAMADVKNLPLAIARLLKISGHTESELLDWARSAGKLDESLSSIGEACMVAEPAVQWIHDNWAEVDKEISRLKKGAKK